MLILLLQFLLILLQVNICQAHNKQIITPLFNTIESINKFAASSEEYPLADNNNWHNPDYTSTYKKSLPSMLSRFTYRLGLSQAMWDSRDFQEIMATITQQRELNGYVDRFIQKMAPADGDQFILLGNLSGAIHSLARDLNALISQHYLDHSLQFTKPNYFLVFNGDVAYGSPYILETLTVIMVLMLKNPRQVFFLRGHYEDKQHWQNSCLAKELTIKAFYASKETIPLSKLINRFFNTLPLALYLIDKTSQTPKELVRISSWGKDRQELDEDSFSNFFNDKQQEISTLKITDKQQNKSSVTLKASYSE